MIQFKVETCDIIDPKYNIILFIKTNRCLNDYVINYFCEELNCDYDSMMKISEGRYKFRYKFKSVHLPLDKYFSHLKHLD